MQRNAIHWGLLALSLLCGGALYVENYFQRARAGAQIPMGHDRRDVAGAGSVAINPNTNAVYFAANYTANQIVVLDGTTNQIAGQIPVPGGVWLVRCAPRSALRQGSRPPVPSRHRNRCEDKLGHQHDCPRPTARCTSRQRHDLHRRQFGDREALWGL